MGAPRRFLLPRLAAAAVPLLLLSVAPRSAQAAFPLSTEDGGTQGSGNGGLDLAVERSHGSGGERETAVAAGVTLGLFPRTDLAVSGGYFLEGTSPDGSASARGVGDTAVTLKQALTEGNGWIPATAVKAGVLLPTGDRSRGLGEGGSSILFTAVADWDAGKVKFHANGGASLVDLAPGGRDRHDRLIGSLAAEWEAAEGAALVSECLWERERHGGRGSDAAELLVGARKEVGAGISLGAGVRWGVTRSAENVAYVAGVTVSLDGNGSAGADDRGPADPL